MAEFYQSDIMPDGTPAPPVPLPATANNAPTSPAAAIPAFPFTSLEDWSAEDSTPSRFPRRLVLIGGAVIALVVVLGLVIAHAAQPKAVPLKFTTGSVLNDNLTVTTSATGQLASGTYDLNFGTSGQISEIDVTPGQNVTAGQVLAKLNPTALQDALNSAQASLNAAQVSLNNAYSSQSINDQIAYDTYEAAIAKDAGNSLNLQKDLDTYNQSLLQAQQQVNSAASQLQNAQTQLSTAQHNLANAVLTAPVAGQIVSVNGQVGTQASGSGSSSFIVLVNLTSFSINAQVNEANIGSVQVGQPVSFTVTAFPSITFYGSVANISPIGTTSSNVVTYPVTVDVDPSSAQQARLFPGMTASLTITTKQVTNAILVPNTALTYARTALRAGRVTTAQTQAALQQAAQQLSASTDANVKLGTANYVLEQQSGKIVAVPVIVGFTNGTETVVLAGLDAGNTVLTGDNKTTTTTTTTTTPTGTQRNGGGGGGGLFGGGL